MQSGGSAPGRPGAAPLASQAGLAELRAAFESASDAFLILDAEGRVLDANGAAAKLLGEPALAGRALHALLGPEAQADFSRLWQGLRHEGVSRGRLILGDAGAPRPVDAIATADVAPGRHLLVLRDHLGAHHGEEAYDEMRQRLARSEKMAALGTLVTGVAHEIRTPLTFVANNVFLLQKMLESAVEEHGMEPRILQDARPHLRDALVGVDRINQLVLELRRFTQRRPGVRARVALDVAVAGAVELFRATSRSRATIVARLGRTPAIEMDVSQIQQVVVNLLENGADAMPHGGEIHVETRVADGRAELVVRDCGVGIPPELQHRVFEGFYTTKPHGTGLGLSIVRRIVAQHGGSMGLESAVGKGTTFTISFPVAVETSPGPAPGSG